MKYPLRLILCLMFPLSMLRAQGGGDAAPPKIYAETPIFDFGERPLSEKVIHTFTLENRGGSLLKIHNVKAACGCTVADISTRELMPGDRATITTSLDLQGRPGSVSRNITVNSNDPAQPALTLTLKGSGYASVMVEPSLLNFMAITANALPTRKLAVTSKSGEPFEIKGVQSASNLVSTEVITITPGLEYEINVTPIIKEGSAPGAFRDMLTLTTTDPKSGTLRVNVMWQIQAPLIITPSVLNLVATANSPAINRHLMVRSNSDFGTPFLVTKAEWPGREDISVLLTNAGSYGWRLEVRGIKPLPEMNGEEILVYTNMPGFETNAIPVKIVSHANVRSLPQPVPPR